MNRYGIASSPFGTLLLAGSEDGLHWLSFMKLPDEALSTLDREFPGQRHAQDHLWAEDIVNKWLVDKSLTVNLSPIGTLFQSIVWNELLNLPLGSTLSYSELARKAGHPTAVRAVASAVARNPIAIFIPCHRVLPKSGGIGNYRWGADKKKALLEWENGASR